MTKSKIIAQLYESKEVEELILKMQPTDIQDDLKQYAFQVLCEKSDEFILELHKNNGLKFYLVRIITNSVFSNTSQFYRIHKNETKIDWKRYAGMMEEKSNHELIERCEREVEKLHWYNQELLKLYAKNGSYRSVSQETGIPLKSIHNAVKKAKNQIKSRLWK